jgi:hypothetical protein
VAIVLSNGFRATPSSTRAYIGPCVRSYLASSRARSHQAAKVAALEAELEAARKTHGCDSIVGPMGSRFGRNSAQSWPPPPTAQRWAGSLWWAFAAGAVIGVRGGLIGHGGAEFRLPLLIGVFGFAALQAVILNKAMSLIVVVDGAAGPPARRVMVRRGTALAGGRQPACRKSRRRLAGCELGYADAVGPSLPRPRRAAPSLIACALAVTHLGPLGILSLGGTARITAGVIAGFAVGIVAAIMGVRGR